MSSSIIVDAVLSVLDHLVDFIGLPGIFIASLLCGALRYVLSVKVRHVTLFIIIAMLRVSSVLPSITSTVFYYYTTTLPIIRTG